MLLGCRHLPHRLLSALHKIPLFLQIGRQGFVPRLILSAANGCRPFGFLIVVAKSYLNRTNAPLPFPSGIHPLPPPRLINILQRNHLHLSLLLQGGDALDGGAGAGQGGDGGYGVIEGGAA